MFINTIGPSGQALTGLRPGRFITFEGGEGAGKSTQVARLAERLRDSGVLVVTTREPGGSPGAEALRHVLLSGAAETLGAEAEAILFAAARADHVDSTIRPALNSGAWVLSDRFADSTRVYQGVEGKVPDKLIAALERIALDGCRPDLTLVLDLPAETGVERAARRRGLDVADRFEREALDQHQRRRQAFLDLARREPERVAVIDAGGAPDAVAAAIWQVVRERFGLSPQPAA